MMRQLSKIASEEDTHLEEATKLTFFFSFTTEGERLLVRMDMWGELVLENYTCVCMERLGNIITSIII